MVLFLKEQQRMVRKRKLFGCESNSQHYERENVVAVFIHGKAWQFKNWFWQEPVVLFQNGEMVGYRTFLSLVLTMSDDPFL